VVYQLFIDLKKAYDSVRKVLYNILIKFNIPMYDSFRKEILYSILIEFNIPLKVVRLYKFV